jgi:glucose/arabinose dehydrogenase
MASRRLWRRRAISLGVGAILGLLVSTYAGSTARPLLLPDGFTQEVVVSGLDLPTAFAPLPDGRFLLAEKRGMVWLYREGDPQPTLFLDIQDRVNNFHDRGLLGIAVDPAFSTNGYIYLAYTYENDAANLTGPKTGRVARYTAVGDTASPDSEFVVLGTQVGSSCHLFPAGADCIPSDSHSHTVGNLKFAQDGTLFVTLGDGARFDTIDVDALRAQELDSLAGKVLRITPAGQGVPSNPFWTGDAHANRSKVWSYGLRNPYRFNLRPGTLTPYLGDVGWSTWEEINVASPGANFGWPCYEGPELQLGYALLPRCRELYARGPSAVQMPLHAWTRRIGQTATGGAFFTGTSYPPEYQGAYFFGDYGRGWIGTLRVDENDQLIPGSVTMFATEQAGLVDLEIGPDGLLYKIDILTGELHRFRYSAANTPPRAMASADPHEGYPPLSVRFSSVGSGDPDGDTLQYTWDFGDGSPLSNEAHPEHTYTTAGLYTARLTVSDGRGGTHSAMARISVGNYSPLVRITSPSGTFRFKVGDVVSYSGEAEDAEDGTIPGSQLSWNITLHHCNGGECHSHPYSTSTGPSGTLTIEDHGDEISFELTLTATDSQGLTGTSTVTIHPQTVQLTLESSPPGLRVVLDGTSAPAPLTRTVIVGSTHTLSTPSPQGGYHFQAWSDGGAQQHTITAGTADVTYTASFHMEECAAGQYRAEYFNTQDLTGWPALVRCEDAPLAHDWGTESPAPEIEPDHFSVRWTGRFLFPTSRQLFTATADDGIRLYVDGVVLIDEWHDQGTTTYQAIHDLPMGEHTVVLEYYENDGSAVARLDWGPAPCAQGEFRADYFNNMDLSGSPVLVACEAAPFSYDWGEASPSWELPADQFSVRWTGRFYFLWAPYTFEATADDGVRVFVNGEPIIDAWWDQEPTTYRATRWLSFDEHTVVMEYYENGGGAVAALRWRRRF